MRRIRNHKAISNNPALMFAAGLKQIISNKSSHPARNGDQELRNIQNIVNKQVPFENPFKTLFRQITY